MLNGQDFDFYFWVEFREGVLGLRFEDASAYSIGKTASCKIKMFVAES